jgi:hypothetical protein
MIINDGPLCLAKYNGYTVLNVNRVNHLFCRAMLWDAAIKNAKHETVIILDGDRLPHYSFFSRAVHLNNGEVLYCKHLMQAKESMALIDYMRYLSDFSLDDVRFKHDHRGMISNGSMPPLKNPMSGCVALRKLDYDAFGGMSHKFKGYGFNDSDCYMRAYMHGCDFIQVNCPEIHMYHERELPHQHFLAMNAFNGVLFYKIWDLPIHGSVLSLLSHLRATVEDACSYNLMGFINFVSYGRKL